MKLKKFKNYVLTFIVCLFGAFAFNSIETKAATIPDMTAQFHYNDSIIYVNEGGKQFDSNGVETGYDAYETTLTLVNFNGKYMLIWNDFIRDRLINFRQCTITKYNGGFSGEFIFGEFNCTSIMDVFNNTSNSTNNSYSRKFYLMSSGDTTTMYDIDKLYIRMQFDSGDYRNFYQDTALYGEGYNDGYRVGYDTGFEYGENSKNTLVGMVGAIFTGPVTMFQEIFNFNVLGINFAEMLLGLVTLLVVIWLIKKFI